MYISTADVSRLICKEVCFVLCNCFFFLFRVPSNMENQKQHFRHILLFYYRKDIMLFKQEKKLFNVYREDVLTERQCQNWIAKFSSDNFDIEGAPRSGRPVKADEDETMVSFEANRLTTTRDIAKRLNLSNSIVYDHVKRLGFVSKLDTWVPRGVGRRITDQHAGSTLRSRGDNEVIGTLFQPP